MTFQFVAPQLRLIAESLIRGEVKTSHFVPEKDAARWISQSIASKMMRIMGLIRDGMIFSVALPVKHARVDRLERNSAETIQILVMTRHSNSAWGKEILKM